MKIYWMDKSGKSLLMIHKLQELGMENIEHKDTLSFRNAKQDWLIVAGEKDWEETLSKKVGHFIFIMNTKNSRNLWRMICFDKLEDLIDESCSEDYIVHRIAKTIAERVEA